MRLGEIELMPHQVEAVEKFKGVKSILVGDDTGTGKTVTAIALMQQLHDFGELGPTLIVSDSFDVWTEHLEKMGVDRDHIHVVNKKNRKPFLESLSSLLIVHGCNFYIVHWMGLKLMVEELKKVQWLCVIGDEIHKGKNRKSQRTKALKQLKCAYKMGLSATPGDDKPQDVWSVLNWLYPKKYTSFWRFVHRFCETETNPWKGYTEFLGPKNVDEFQSEIEPFYISRPLEVVDDTISDYEYYTIDVVMSDSQTVAYESMAKEAIAQLGNDYVVAGAQLAVHMRMQQFAMAYGLAEYKWVNKFVNGKIEKVRKTIVHQIEPSPKLDALMAVLYGEGDNKVIVFTQFRDIVKLACRRMDDAGIKYVAVMGGTGNLDQVVKSFQEDEAIKVFIGIVDVVSEQTTLTASDVEVFLDRHWSSRMNKQAQGRFRRIGQERVPRVIDIRTLYTVDFGRLERVRTKQQWVDHMFGKVE